MFMLDVFRLSIDMGYKEDGEIISSRSKREKEEYKTQ